MAVVVAADAAADAAAAAVDKGTVGELLKILEENKAGEDTAVVSACAGSSDSGGGDGGESMADGG